MKDLSNYRKSYEKSELVEASIPTNPLHLFMQWFNEAEQFGISGEVNAMTVSTIGLDGFPKSRVALLKQFDDRGFVFFTNYNSEKGKALLVNPNICLSFFWQDMERQVIIKGVADKVSSEVSDEYFSSRPIGSQMGAIVSPQSDVIPSREYLEEGLKIIEERAVSDKLTRPEHWGGYLVRPVEVEFWQGRANRLHDRIRYTQDAAGSWHIGRLAP